MKILGRLLLLVAAGLIFGFNIPSLITTIQGFDWSAFNPSLVEHWRVVWALVGRGLVLLTGVVALTCCLAGKTTFLLALIALIQIGFAIYNVVIGVQNGSITADWKVILDVCVTFAIPIIYFLGTLFLSFGK